MHVRVCVYVCARVCVCVCVCMYMHACVKVLPLHGCWHLLLQPIVFKRYPHSGFYSV